MKERAKNIAWGALGAVAASAAWAVFSGGVGDFLQMRQSAFNAASQETTNRLERNIDSLAKKIESFSEIPGSIESMRKMLVGISGDVTTTKKEQERLDALTTKLDRRQGYMWDTLGQLCSLEPSIDCAFRNADWSYDLPYTRFFTLSSGREFELDPEIIFGWGREKLFTAAIEPRSPRRPDIVRFERL